MDQPPAVALTAFADAWPRAIETEIGAALCAIGHGKELWLLNTLPTRKNLCLWKLRQSSDCQFCLLPETLLHVVASCKVCLEQGRYTWRHNSILNSLATSLKVVEGSSLYANISGFPSPSIITGDDLRSDLL